MKTGRHTYIFDKEVFIPFTDSIAGPVEGEGSFGSFYDTVLENDEWGCKSFEKAEIKMHTETLRYLIEKAALKPEEVDCIMGGDLLNQIIPSTFSAREFDIPFMGIYSACASFGQALVQAAMMINCGLMKNIMCCTSSHYATAERLYRFPLEMGTQPAPTSQWTVTGTGSCVVSAGAKEKCPKITGATIGKVIDLGINDANNMGAAMAPAAADSITRYFKDTGRRPDDFDLILTGDLGLFGRELCFELCEKEGFTLDNLNDCGCMIYDVKQRRNIQGGSGAGCNSVVFCSYIFKELLAGNFKRILFAPTGALLSKCSSLQGETIPGICHVISVEM